MGSRQGGGRSAGSPRGPMVRSAPPGRNQSTSLPSKPVQPPARQATPPRSAVRQPQPKQPGLFSQMAATAGGVAVGSAVGHAVGHALTGGGNAPPGAGPQEQYESLRESASTEPTGPCAWEIKQFLQCAQGNADLNLCQGFNEALQQCKQHNNLNV